MTKLFLVTAALSGFLAVSLGAFGAHALKAQLDAHLLAVFQTGVQYHFYHTAALLAVALLQRQLTATHLINSSGIAFIAGILLFSGSLYLLAITGTRWLGAITPIGGLAFLIGWACLGLAAFKHYGH